MSAREAMIPGDVLKQGRGLNWWQLHPHGLHRGGEKERRFVLRAALLTALMTVLGYWWNHEGEESKQRVVYLEWELRLGEKKK